MPQTPPSTEAMASAEPRCLSPIVTPSLQAYSDWLAVGFTTRPTPVGDPALSAEALATARQQWLQAIAGPAYSAEAPLLVPRQTHGCHYVLASEACATSTLLKATDALILDTSGVAGLIQVADCVPVVLVAPQQRLVALVHAGWRGTAARIVPAVLAQLLRMGGQAAECHAVLGPCIGQADYEVSWDVANALAHSTGLSISDFWETPALCQLSENGRPQVSLQQILTHQLAAQGLTNVERIALSTYSEQGRLWSYRRGATQRQGLLALKHG